MLYQLKCRSDFKNKKRDVAAFWIDLQGRKIYIRYFPVWDKEDNYLGIFQFGIKKTITSVALKSLRTSQKYRR